MIKVFTQKKLEEYVKESVERQGLEKIDNAVRAMVLKQMSLYGSGEEMLLDIFRRNHRDLYHAFLDRLRPLLEELSVNVYREGLHSQIESKAAEIEASLSKKLKKMFTDELKNKDFLKELVKEINEYQIKGTQYD